MAAQNRPVGSGADGGRKRDDETRAVLMVNVPCICRHSAQIQASGSPDDGWPARGNHRLQGSRKWQREARVAPGRQMGLPRQATSREAEGETILRRSSHPKACIESPPRPQLRLGGDFRCLLARREGICWRACAGTPGPDRREVSYGHVARMTAQSTRAMLRDGFPVRPLAQRAGRGHNPAHDGQEKQADDGG